MIGSYELFTSIEILGKRRGNSTAPNLARTLCSTNAIESLTSVCREHAANVKRCRDRQMALRWCAALEREFPESVGPVVHNEDVNAA
ncbi:hypothetical protein [Rhodococcus sp. 3A]|uniref:hypothetical protein n=1 Tax=Rhodococcus sp. 3A TaxID=2834581 RepID=UPI0037C58A98